MVSKTRLSLPLPKTAIAFRPEYLDFNRGIHVGNLEENARITRILKNELEAYYGEPFVTERWGRGVYWQWIGFLPRSNRDAKPVSSKVSFGCSKFFLMVNTKEKLFKCGLQVERGCVKTPRDYPASGLAPDWDWHRLMKSLKPQGEMNRELTRLVEREGFLIQAGAWGDALRISRSSWQGSLKLRKALALAPQDQWAAFQLYYPMPEDEVKSSNGVDLVDAMLAVFREVTPAMNLCMQIQLCDGRSR